MQAHKQNHIVKKPEQTAALLRSHKPAFQHGKKTVRDWIKHIFPTLPISISLQSMTITCGKKNSRNQRKKAGRKANEQIRGKITVKQKKLKEVGNWLYGASHKFAFFVNIMHLLTSSTKALSQIFFFWKWFNQFLKKCEEILQQTCPITLCGRQGIRLSWPLNVDRFSDWHHIPRTGKAANGHRHQVDLRQNCSKADSYLLTSRCT